MTNTTTTVKYERLNATTYTVLHDDGVTNPGTPSPVGTVVKETWANLPGAPWWVAFHAGEHGQPGYGYAGSTRKEAVESMLCG